MNEILKGRNGHYYMLIDNPTLSVCKGCSLINYRHKYPMVSCHDIKKKLFGYKSEVFCCDVKKIIIDISEGI